LRGGSRRVRGGSRGGCGGTYGRGKEWPELLRGQGDATPGRGKLHFANYRKRRFLSRKGGLFRLGRGRRRRSRDVFALYGAAILLP
jgi:hypothetical protein